MSSEYQPKGDDALRLWSKGCRYMVSVWQVKLYDPFIAHGSYLSALEMYHDKTLYKFSPLYFTLLLWVLFVLDGGLHRLYPVSRSTDLNRTAKLCTARVHRVEQSAAARHQHLNEHVRLAAAGNLSSWTTMKTIRRRCEVSAIQASSVCGLTYFLSTTDSVCIHSWRPDYSAELVKYHLSDYVAVQTIRTAAWTQISRVAASRLY